MKTPAWMRACALAGALLAAGRCAGVGEEWGAAWSAAELAVLRSLQLEQLPPPAVDPSNRYERLPAAVALGKRLFFDVRFSANQQVSCASCHAPQQQFQDGRPVGQGVGTGLRRTMPVMDSGRSAWLFWDGRKDSLWSQALGPLEDANEHGGNRLAYARVLRQHYRADYEAVFQPLPALDGLPDNASPNGTRAERAAWERLGAERQQQVSRVFANMGKAIAAYEKTLHVGPARLDAYIAATLRHDAGAEQLLSASEKRGLRLFMGKAACVSCHGGPLLTDQHFHNTGVAPRDAARPDHGRAAAIAAVRRDPFNCLGPYSDAPVGGCAELEFIADDDPHMAGAFKTPSLRNVAQRAPYMHAGQIGTLSEVVRHYAVAPRAAVGHNERRPLALSEQEVADLVALLGTLSGPVLEAPGGQAVAAF
jgi:cytochrome c peroxidase